MILLVLFASVVVGAFHACAAPDVGKACGCTFGGASCNPMGGGVVVANGGQVGGGPVCTSAFCCSTSVLACALPQCCASCGDGVTDTYEQCEQTAVADSACCNTNCLFTTSTCTDDGLECTTDVCASGICTHPAKSTATPCTTDNNVCTDDFCGSGAAAGTCVHTSTSGGPCLNPADACPDVCVSGSCPNTAGCGGGAGDPHIFGPFGEAFEFHGQGGGVYNMFSSRQIVVNAQMMSEGPENHFMTKIAVSFANITLLFDTINRPANYLDKMNALLEPLGAHATGNKYQTELHLCDGQIVEISQMHSGQYFFLNVDVAIAGCHDDFNGVIGQLYQCAYTAGAFVWDSANEELFRVPSLDSAAGLFDSSSSCYERHEYGTAFPAKKK